MTCSLGCLVQQQLIAVGWQQQHWRYGLARARGGNRTETLHHADTSLPPPSPPSLISQPMNSNYFLWIAVIVAVLAVMSKMIGAI